MKLCGVMMLLCLAAVAEEAKATLGDVAWIAGRWEGSGLGGDCEEVWTQPKAGSMMGMFRIIKNGKTALYEILQIVEEGGSLTLRVRHFSPDFKAREEMDRPAVFPLLKVEKDRVAFDGLTFVREAADRISVYVKFHNKADPSKSREEKFAYRRATGM